MPTVTARSLKVTVVIEIDATSLLAIAVAESGPARTVLTIRTPDRTVTADLASKSIRRAQAEIHEHGPDGCTALVQGKLGAGDCILEASLVVQPKMAKVAVS